ncbi:MAG: M23 family metallopeptidase [Bacteroidota bacterium]
MRAFLREFTRRHDGAYTVVVMEDDGLTQPRQYTVEPQRLVWLAAGTAVGVMVVTICLVAFTPLRTWIPGHGDEVLRQTAQANAIRIAALQDSLQVQQDYLERMRSLIIGDVNDEATTSTSAVPQDEGPPNPPLPIDPSTTVDGTPVLDTGAPLLSGEILPSLADRGDGRYLPGLRLPTSPPVTGLVTRGFDARSGHFAIDIAVQEGTLVRSVGDGYVIFADWTHEGGHSIFVQHAGGFVSVYKHNEQLLKRIGDRVREREAVAVSGNSGEITTGPHLHFELWRHGLAQDPAAYLTVP